MKNTRYSLRALARLLAYPDAQLRSVLAPLIAAIDEEAAVPAARRAELRALAADLGADELMLSTLLPSLEARQASLTRVAAAMQ